MIDKNISITNEFKAQTINMLIGQCNGYVDYGIISKEDFEAISAILKEGIRSFAEREKEFITRREAADILKVSERTIDRYADTGLIERKKIGPRNVRFVKEDLIQIGA